MELNKGQEQAFAEVREWVAGNEPYYFLSGQAGTGKTYLANTIKEWIEENIGRRVYVTATTNKAAAVLSASLPDMQEACTIYSLLNLRVQTDFTTGRQFLQRNRGGEMPEYASFILVDEASMIDPETMEYINDASEELGLRVLFLGDAYQLPPVNAGIMPVTSASIRASYLTEIMRANKREDLEKVYADSRSMVVNDEGIYLPSSSENVTVFPHEGSKAYLETLLHHNPHTKILAFTNAAVEGANKIARELLNLPGIPQPGDTLVAEDIVIVNANRLAYIGEEIEVAEVEDTVCVLDGIEYPAQYIVSTLHKRFLRMVDSQARQQCLKSLAARKDWRTYYNVKESVADLRFVHASTVHKSQGSTYKDVLVMAPNIMSCPGISTRRRLLYVAYTRASEHLHVMVS